MERIPGDGWEDALDEYKRVKDDLYAGQTPRPKGDDSGTTLRELVNLYLTDKLALVESSELAQRTFDAYNSTCAFLLASLGKSTTLDSLGPNDFRRLRAAMSKVWGPIRLRNEMTVVEGLFRRAAKDGLISRSIPFGSAWVKPSAKVLRLQRASKGPKMFERAELLTLLDHASVNMKGMILLGINAALGNTEIGLLSLKLIDFEGGWLNYPRVKTGIDRRIPLWRETLTALRTVIANRPKSKDPDDDGLIFMGKHGVNYVGKHKGYRVAQEMARTLAKARIEGRAFYDLRRTFQTVADDSRDFVAVRYLMGHAPPPGDMASIYRQRISDERLQAVVDHVRQWLFLETNTPQQYFRTNPQSLLQADRHGR